MNNNKKLKEGNLVYIFEKGTGIRYHSISEKGHRPFVVLSIKLNKIILLPLSSVKKTNNFIDDWSQCNTIKASEINKLKNDSYLRYDIPFIMDNKYFSKLKEKNIFENDIEKISPKIIIIKWKIFPISKSIIKQNKKRLIQLLK